MQLGWEAETGRLQRDDIDELCDLDNIVTHAGYQRRREVLTTVLHGLQRAVRKIDDQLQRIHADLEWRAMAGRSREHKVRQIMQVDLAIKRCISLERTIQEVQPDIEARTFMWAARELLPPDTYVAIMERAAGWVGDDGQIPGVVVDRHIKAERAAKRGPIWQAMRDNFTKKGRSEQSSGQPRPQAQRV